MLAQSESSSAKKKQKNPQKNPLGERVEAGEYQRGYSNSSGER